jgi:Na+/melibiose symporter-like transporter
VAGVLAVTGFVSSTAEQDVTQPSSAVTGIVLAFSLLPAVLAALSVPLVLRYDLTPDRLHELVGAGSRA